MPLFGVPRRRVARVADDSWLSWYLNARREWGERYGSYISAARRWRIVAVASLALAGVCATGLAVVATQARVIPYIVEVDGKHRPLRVYPADELRGGEPHVVRAELASFVSELRGVSSDAGVQRAAVERVYAHLSAGEPATNAIGEWFKSNNPFDRAASETVAVEVSQVLLIGGNTWRIEWVERPRSRAGKALDEVWMTGTATVVQGDVSEEMLILNPAGVYVQDFDWSRDLRWRERS